MERSFSRHSSTFSRTARARPFHSVSVSDFVIRQAYSGTGQERSSLTSRVHPLQPQDHCFGVRGQESRVRYAG